MAKYQIEFSCGHTETRDIIGRVSDRESKAEWMAQGLCSECWEEEKKRQFEEQKMKAAEEAREYGLPELTGSEKQIAWANTLRQEWIKKIEKHIGQIQNVIDKNREKQPEQVTEAEKKFGIMKSVVDNILIKTIDAKYWIDNREENPIAIINEATKKELEKSIIEPPKEDREQAMEDMTIRPEAPITSLVTEIRIQDDLVTAKLPERSEDFRVILRDLRFEWQNGRWERKTNEIIGATMDRAVELGAKLLASGFPIRIYNDELQRKILAGEFESECDRWIMQYEKGFRVWWRREEDFYKESKRLPGSRWISSKRSMYIPREAYRELQDFAARYAFKFTAKAQELMTEAHQAFEAAMIADVTAPKKEKLPQPGSRPKLNPVEGEVDESLRDEN